MLSQPVPYCLPLFRGHVAIAFAERFPAIDRQIMETPEVFTDSCLLSRVQTLELFVTLADSCALVLAEAAPGLEALPGRCSVLYFHFGPALRTLGQA